MRVNAKGRVTIPAAIRRAAGLLPYMDVESEFDGSGVRIVHSSSPRKGEPWGAVDCRVAELRHEDHDHRCNYGADAG
jgi:bifunctional DNA-binding transcriptional regulator/antitoxin component of YhaV-PrlF toxin-antitoxin module